MIGLPGIFQPRAAVAYFFTVVAEVAALAGVAPRIAAEIEAAADFLARPSSSSCKHQAAEIAAQLEGTVPVVYGADLTAPVARRWKTPGEREREAAGLLRRAARGRPQRHLRLGGRRPASTALAAVFLEDRDAAPADRPPLRADRRGGRRAPAPRRAGRDRGRDAAPRGCSGRRCSATWSRSSWPRAAASTRSRSRRSTASSGR